MIFLGIDPGKKGALAFLSDDPLFGTSIVPFAKINEIAIANAIGFYDDKMFAMLEKVHSMPAQGVVSAFSFGTSYGFLRGVLTAHGIPFQDAEASLWPKEFGLASRRKKGEERTKADIKRANLACAQRLFPGVEGLTIHTADALLLAEYARRKHGGVK